MTPITRSMTRVVTDSDLQVVYEMFHEIKIGLNNCEVVEGKEYKKGVVLALFDYLCVMKPHLCKLGKRFGRVLNDKLVEFQETENDVVFHNKCSFYKRELSSYISWAYDGVDLIT
jgi:hypothetical protein